MVSIRHCCLGPLRSCEWRCERCSPVFQSGRNDKAQEFFLKQASELQNQAEWKDWFVLPFLPAPDSNPTFATYFSRQWADTFIVSLHNFLSVLFQCMHILFCN